MLLLQARGFSYTDIGTLGALYWAALILAEIPTGYIGDRLGQRRGLFISALVTAAGIGGLGLAHTFLPCALALATWAVGTTFRSGTADAWLYSALAESETPAAYTTVRGRGRAVKLAATAITAVIGSFLYSKILIAPFLLTTGLLGINAIIVLSFSTVTNPPSRSQSESGHLMTTWRELTQVFRHPEVRGFVSYTVLLFGLVEVTRTFIQPIVVGKQVGLPVVAVGGLYASFNVVAAGVSGVTGAIERIVGIRRWFLLAPFLLAGSFMLLPVVPAFTVPSFVGMEAIWRVSQTFQSGVVNDWTGDRRRATVLSVVSMSGGVAAIVFRTVGGVLADTAGPLVMLAVLAIVFVVGGAALLAITPRFNRETTQSDTSE